MSRLLLIYSRVCALTYYLPHFQCVIMLKVASFYPFLTGPSLGFSPAHILFSAVFGTVWLRMSGFSILTNRKHAMVALVHSAIFLLVVVRQMVAATPAASMWFPSKVSPGTWILCGIFAVVSAILLWLFIVSRGRLEKIYFLDCAPMNATSGLLRTTAGDRAFHAGLYLRVVMCWSARSWRDC
jgi:hypothetical protein